MSVLIETLWNVKMFAHGITSPDVPFRINRNIVECKECLQRVQEVRIRSINRNIVECKVTVISFLIP